MKLHLISLPFDVCYDDTYKNIITACNSGVQFEKKEQGWLPGYDSRMFLVDLSLFSTVFDKTYTVISVVNIKTNNENQ